MPASDNPFPGMNPFLQAYWSDVHIRLVVGIADQLGDRLPEDLVVRAEERVEVANGQKDYRPDVAVLEDWRSGFPPVGTSVTAAAGIALTEPIVVFVEPETERWLEIRNIQDELVTAIEVLSPGNKKEPGAGEYRRKQHDFLSAGVNLVEIDLLRGGQHVLAVDPDAFKRPAGSDYLVCVARQQHGHTSRREVYPCSFREALPTIRVPLRAGDPDAPLALQPLIDRIYRTARYWRTAHLRALRPPLPPDDAAWVDERLKAAGLK